jgi:hypothetical protein
MLAIAPFLETPFFVSEYREVSKGRRPGPLSIWWTLLAAGCRHRPGCGQLCRFGPNYTGLVDCVVTNNAMNEGALQTLLLDAGGTADGAIVRDNPGRVFRFDQPRNCQGLTQGMSARAYAGARANGGQASLQGGHALS